MGASTRDMVSTDVFLTWHGHSAMKRHPGHAGTVSYLPTWDDCRTLLREFARSVSQCDETERGD